MMNATRTTLVALIAMALGAAHALPVVQKTLPLGNNTQGIATDPGLARVFITNFNDGTGTAVNVNALTVDDTVPIGANPRRLIADAAHHRVYVVMATTPGTLLIADSAGAAGIVYVPVGNIRARWAPTCPSARFTSATWTATACRWSARRPAASSPPSRWERLRRHRFPTTF
jgi:DNA-binding beta-propeller fold protein YncE